MSYQLDTDTCVQWLRGRNPTLKAPFAARTPADVQVSAGDARGWPAFSRAVEVAPVDADVARHYALLRAALETRGKSIGPNDLWIAATALACGATLVTGNPREFRRMPRLHLENWLGR